MGSNSCSSKISADIFSPWHCVKTHLNAPEKWQSVYFHRHAQTFFHIVIIKSRYVKPFPMMLSCLLIKPISVKKEKDNMH